MKQFVQLTVFILLSTAGFSQKSFKRFAHEYKNNQEFFYSALSDKTINAYQKAQDRDNELTDALEDVSSIKVMNFIPESKQQIEEFILGAQHNFKLESYVPFKSILSNSHSQLIYLKENDNSISSLLVINTCQTLVSLVEINGDLRLDKLAAVQRYFNIDGLENIQFETPDAPPGAPMKISVYNQRGHKLIESNPSTKVEVNGHQPMVDFETFLKKINPNCIHNITIKPSLSDDKDDRISIELEGNETDLFTVCEGVLYFGQNGYLHSIAIDDECSPKMLLNCNDLPLKDIQLIEPQQVKSISYTTNPRICQGQLKGEFVVLETKN